MAALPQPPLRLQEEQGFIAVQEISLLLQALTALPSPIQAVPPLGLPYSLQNFRSFQPLHRQRQFYAMAALLQSPLLLQEAQGFIAVQEISRLLQARTALPSPIQTVAPLRLP